MNRGGWARIGVLVLIVLGEVSYMTLQGVTIGRDAFYRGVLWLGGVVVSGVGMLLLWSAKVQWDNRASLVEVKTTLKGEGGVLDRLSTAEVEMKGFSQKLEDSHESTVGRVSEMIANLDGRVEKQTERIDKLFERRAHQRGEWTGTGPPPAAEG